MVEETASQEKSLKQLKEELVSLGMPESETNSFNTKAQILAVINTLRAKDEVKRVDTLEQKDPPDVERLFEKSYLSKARIMREKLMSQPKIRIIIPLAAGEKPGNVEWRTDKNGEKYQYCASGAYETVQLNGFKYLIGKGSYQEVPEQIADVISKSLNQTMMAGSKIKLDRIDERTGRPMNEVI